jgi:hypothetical protein
MYLKEIGINEKNWVNSAQDSSYSYLIWIYWIALVKPQGFTSYGVSCRYLYNIDQQL